MRDSAVTLRARKLDTAHRNLPHPLVWDKTNDTRPLGQVTQMATDSDSVWGPLVSDVSHPTEAEMKLCLDTPTIRLLTGN
jgi:hypothetical protein